MSSEYKTVKQLEQEATYLEGYMTKEEINRLAKLSKEGDKEAEEALILGHLKLVNFMIQKYKDRGLPYEDLFQEGCIALIQAVKNYDYTRGTLLSSYASYYIIRNIQRALMKEELIRKPEALCLELKRYQYIKNALHVEYGRVPTDEEIAKEMNVSLAHIKELNRWHYQYISLDAPSKKTSNQNCYNGTEKARRIPEPQDMREPVDSQVFRKMEMIDLNGYEKLLTRKELRVLSLRFNQEHEDMTFKDIALKLGYSTEGVRLTYIQAINKLRNYINQDTNI